MSLKSKVEIFSACVLLFFSSSGFAAKKSCRVYYPMIAKKSDLRDSKYPILSKTEKQHFRCKVESGKLVSENVSSESISRGLFVIDKKGQMFFNRDSIYRYSELGHISFTNQRDVIFAGAISTDAQGNIIRVTTESGHYQPDVYAVTQVLEILEKKGVDSSKVRVGFGTPSNAIDLVLLRGSDFAFLKPDSRGKDIIKC